MESFEFMVFLLYEGFEDKFFNILIIECKCYKCFFEFGVFEDGIGLLYCDWYYIGK